MNQQVYHFHNTVNGQMSLTNCEVHIHSHAGQVIVNGGRLINHGSLGMTIRNGGTLVNNEEKIVYRDRVVEKPVVQRVFIPDTGNEIALNKLREENNDLLIEIDRLKKEIQKKDIKLHEQRFYHSDQWLKQQMSSLKEENSQLKRKVRKLEKSCVTDESLFNENRTLQNELTFCKQQAENLRIKTNQRIAELEDNICGLIEANHRQAEKIDHLTRQKWTSRPRAEYEPTEKDLMMISQNLRLFLDGEDTHLEDY